MPAIPNALCDLSPVYLVTSAQRLLPYVLKYHMHSASSTISLPDGPVLGTRVILPAAIVEGLLCVQARTGATGSAMKVTPPFLPSFNAWICYHAATCIVKSVSDTAALSNFWRELASATTDEATSIMDLPAIPAEAGFLPQMERLYVRDCYVQLTDMATDGGGHLVCIIQLSIHGLHSSMFPFISFA